MKHTVRIEGDGMPKTTRVFLDDKDISAAVRKVRINIAVDEVPTVDLLLIAYAELPDELRAKVRADTEFADWGFGEL